jgi:hypothetical protein
VGAFRRQFRRPHSYCILHNSSFPTSPPPALNFGVLLSAIGYQGDLWLWRRRPRRWVKAASRRQWIRPPPPSGSHPVTSGHIPSHSVIPGHIPSHSVIPGHTPSHPVTSRHTQSHPVTPGHIRSHPVTSGHTRSHPVTSSHTQSHPVTPSHIRSHPVTEPAVAKGFGGQGRRSAHHGRGPVAVSPFNFSTF